MGLRNHRCVNRAMDFHAQPNAMSVQIPASPPLTPIKRRPKRKNPTDVDQLSCDCPRQRVSPPVKEQLTGGYGTKYVVASNHLEDSYRNKQGHPQDPAYNSIPPLYTYRYLICNGEISLDATIRSQRRRPRPSRPGTLENIFELEAMNSWYRMSQFSLNLIVDASIPASICCSDVEHCQIERGNALGNLYGLSDLPFIYAMLFCNLHISVYNVDLAFDSYASHDQRHPLQVISHKLSRILRARVNQMVNFTLTLSLWPGPVGDRSRRGHDPYFDTVEDVKAMWRMLAPVTKTPGLQWIKIKRLKGRAMWLGDKTSLFPACEPLVVVGDELKQISIPSLIWP